MSRVMPELKKGHVVALSLLLKKGACHVVNKSGSCVGIDCDKCMLSRECYEFDPEVHLADWEIDYDK
jgi:hypothetical protein